MRQVVVIHGGDTFETYEKYLRFLRHFDIDLDDYLDGKKGWKSNLQTSLGEEYEVVLPDMPNSFNAKYPEWQIWFEKFIPFLNGGVILVGHSLGGTFLAKYLSENTFPKKIRAVYLVATPFDDSYDYTLSDFTLPKKLNLQTKNVVIYHSSDDKVVPFADLNKYSAAINNVIVKQFTDRGHFNQEEFPELVEDIKAMSTRQE
ncbi:MAG: hypothetical protein A2832_00020 [Candidatus Zambryskibacteria bacterium RIFCSPHIGHO2_01_FULL_44_22b]|uniref:AB hydrolase-1 domain-containing protein n=1 Tax=Candidatus Zambryskibacteria bacterium RIFCSPHIGHO2_01_FULL_44_22b TaxID=1802737 RepID=A0A1G2T2C1_9BACT|nr:MAG: hypothetical protein A2832_00020 [Candidatus Zambryskibacteria bacterium RIFCSPHIGHO2_01_FULL_44_22b]